MRKIAIAKCPRPFGKKYKIMFYTFGDIAYLATYFISNSIKSEEFLRDIETIYIVGYDANKLEDERKIKKLQGNLDYDSNEAKVIAPLTQVRPVLASDVGDFIPDTDILFVTANAAPHDVKDRKDICDYNLPLIEELAPLIKLNPDIHVNIVSNLPGVLSQKLLLETDLNPYQISGNSLVDKNRLDLKITKMFQQEEESRKVKATEGFCIGHHENPWPVINRLRVDFGEGFVEELLSEERQQEFYQFVEKYGKKQFEIKERSGLERHITTEETAATVKDYALAFVNGDILINPEIFIDGLYQEAPTFLPDQFAICHGELWGRLNDLDNKELEKRREELKETLKDRFDISSKKVYAKTRYDFKPLPTSTGAGLHPSETKLNIEDLVEVNLFALTNKGYCSYNLLESRDPAGEPFAIEGFENPRLTDLLAADADGERFATVVQEVDGKYWLVCFSSGEETKRIELGDLCPTSLELVDDYAFVSLDKNVIEGKKGGYAALRVDLKEGTWQGYKQSFGDCSCVRAVDSDAVYCSINNIGGNRHKISFWARAPKKTGIAKFHPKYPVNNFQLVSDAVEPIGVVYSNKDENQVRLFNLKQLSEVKHDEIKSIDGIFDSHMHEDCAYLSTVEKDNEGKQIVVIEKYANGQDLFEGEDSVASVQTSSINGKIKYLKGKHGFIVAVTKNNRIYVINAEDGSFAQEKPYRVSGANTSYSCIAIKRKC